MPNCDVIERSDTNVMVWSRRRRRRRRLPGLYRTEGWGQDSARNFFVWLFRPGEPLLWPLPAFNGGWVPALAAHFLFYVHLWSQYLRKQTLGSCCSLYIPRSFARACLLRPSCLFDLSKRDGRKHCAPLVRVQRLCL